MPPRSADQDRRAVTIMRPDTKTVSAKVTAIGTTVDGGDGKDQTSGPPKLNVTVTPDDRPRWPTSTPPRCRCR